MGSVYPALPWESPPKPECVTTAQKTGISGQMRPVEGIIGTSKAAYGLGRISVRLEETTRCVIGGLCC